MPSPSPTIGKRIWGYVSTQHLGIVALLLVVGGGGTAYAAGQRAKNSVTSKQIKNGTVNGPDLRNSAVTVKKLADGSVTVTKLGDGAVTATKIGDAQVIGAKIADGSISGAKIADGQVTGADIADRTIGASKLDPATVGDVMSASGSLTSGAPDKDILVVDGFGVLKAQCTTPNTMSFFYALDSPIQQKARAFGRDAIDNNPIGTAAIAGTAGGVGYAGALHQLLAGEVSTFTAERVLQIDFTIDPGCIYRLRATLDHNDAP